MNTMQAKQLIGEIRLLREMLEDKLTLLTVGLSNVT